MNRQRIVEPMLLRVTEAAELASIGRSMAYQLVASGEWPSVSIGRSRRVPLHALRRWVEQMQARAESRDGSLTDDGPD